MPLFPPNTIYAGEPLDTLYLRYSLRCHVEREQDKAYHWLTMEKIYDAILPLINGWADCRLNTDQALQRRIGKVAADGRFRSTFRNAAAGGLQSLTRERLKKVCTLHLSDDALLIDKFANGGLINGHFFTPEHPEWPHFFLTEIMAMKHRLKRARSITHRSMPFDFYLRVGGYDHQYATSATQPINQALDIFVWKDLMPITDSDALVRRIGSLTSAKHIWRAESGFKGASYTDDAGYLKLRHTVEDAIEDAVDGRNRFGSVWVDMLA
jgi:hypothetical protein